MSIGYFIVELFNGILNYILPAALRVNDISLGGRVISHVLYALTDLGVAEALASGPLSVAELCDKLGC